MSLIKRVKEVRVKTREQSVKQSTEEASDEKEQGGGRGIQCQNNRIIMSQELISRTHI